MECAPKEMFDQARQKLVDVAPSPAPSSLSKTVTHENLTHETPGLSAQTKCSHGVFTCRAPAETLVGENFGGGRRDERFFDGSRRSTTVMSAAL